MDKVINEFKVIETDDGYRIEIKGDKQKMKGWFEGHRKRAKHRHGRGWGPFGFGPRFWGHMPPWWGAWEFEVEEDEDDGPEEV